MAPVTNIAPRKRRTNEERTAETRGRLLEAAVDCLNRVGYAGATTILISDTSGVTRGGMLHHFPSKVELMIGAAEHCLEKMREGRMAYQPGPPTLAAILDVEAGRYGVALTEIMIGSRSDPELAARFKPVADMLLERQRGAAAHISQRNGVKDVSAVEVAVWLNMAAIRGLSLMQLAGVDPGLTERALKLMGGNFARTMKRIREKEAEAGKSA